MSSEAGPVGRQDDQSFGFWPGTQCTRRCSQLVEGLFQVFRQAALRDPLTGLANRRLVEEREPSLMGSTDSSRATVLYVDLDDFKVTNDTFGHRTEDARSPSWLSLRYGQCPEAGGNFTLWGPFWKEH
ncbi:GGDEF domain-containing protein [Pseudarthrobacter sp. S9]|uniref:GGDEF domain-containing protein n=1 Tax=Pseudarthrobacter sp. S9 TaxID=3418421 RepID=UPI003D054504